MIPSKLFIYIIATWALFALAVGFFPQAISGWQVSGFVLLLIAIIDFRNSLELPIPEIKRELSTSLAHGEISLVKLYLKLDTKRLLYLQIFDRVPETFQFESMPINISASPNELYSVQYRVKPLKRGDAIFSSTFVRILSPFQLWHRQLSIKNSTPVRVFPNFSSITKYTLLALANREALMGIQQKRLRGEGSEFHQLREYRKGDSQRQINWKASIRLQKMISMEYQQEKDQKIIFLLDCGRRMTAVDGAFSHFDEALNSLLLLGYVALRQGDAVGLQCFGNNNRYLSPKKGITTIKRLLNFSYDLEANLEAPDYLSAVKNLLAYEKRRSLVIWLTNLRDDDAEELQPAISLLKRFHLVLIANLKESLLDRLDAGIPDNFQQALSVASAIEFQQRRQQAFGNLSREGVILIDTIPQNLPSSLVNAYLEIKASGRL